MYNLSNPSRVIFILNIKNLKIKFIINPIKYFYKSY